MFSYFIDFSYSIEDVFLVVTHVTTHFIMCNAKNFQNNIYRCFKQ
jgi:hypothetical protein